MRYLLLILFFTLQAFGYGANANDLQENSFKKELTSIKSSSEERSNVEFRYQGQYFDEETELCYSRFRYYSPDTGTFISQDPIGLAGNNPNMYGYVFDSNTEIDPFGLDCSAAKKTQVHHIIPNAVYKLFRKDLKKVKGFVQAKAHKNAKTRTNLIDLETPFHGNHPKYNDFVEKELDILKNSTEGLTTENVSKLQNDLRDLIGEAQNSGSTLNEFFKGLLVP